ncbi:breast cancer anti-estrogen resistance protein 3 homolog isoform X1 [Hylaeus anthracinus]|uniref:breast cancer anti-estrogen resistance protein 3 homolog isoform X1 n=1 Tax=Hylaeus anthracinus TaxID=313031 RepID=UPI0023B8F5AB|nr:breast cancer anti-estrogen resistance protein 3 homolog isoform X1 [Hylaeus anthracinus]
MIVIDKDREQKSTGRRMTWNFRFPSMGTLQNLGASGRRRKRNGIHSSASCKDLYQKRHTIHLQPEVIIQKEPSIIGTPLSPEDLTEESRRSSEVKTEVAEEEAAVDIREHRDACSRESVAKRVDSNDYSNLPMEPPEESTRKLLERELRLLDPRDLRSHAWYHGSTLRGGRKGAEAEVPNDGDFLVRDCASQPGNYVLTVRWKGQPLHFVINRVVIQPETVYERAQYQFEDEAFDTVADLITFYVGSGRPISQASGARIITPKPRCVPLTCVPGPTNSQHCSSPSSSSLSTGSPPRLPRKQQRSHSLTAQHHPSDQYDGRQPSNQQPLPHVPVQSSTLPRVPPIQNQPPSCSLSLGRQKITRVISDPALQQQQQPIHQPSSLNHQNSLSAAPPKPPRVPYVPNHQHHTIHHHHHHHHHHQGYQASGSDSGNGSGDSEFETNNSGGTSNPSSSVPIKGVVIRSHYTTSNDGTNGNNGNEYELSAEEQLVVAAPSMEIATSLDIEGFTTLLLPTGDHRPLDPTALRGVSGMLLDSAPRVLASHLTKIDLELALQPGPGNRNGLSGIELATLPHGRQARMDLIERSECLKLLVAVTVLAGATAIERAGTISKWIKVAIDTKTALGNLYGFCGVMLGLCLPQIQRLANTWHLLRQKHTDEAFSFEAKLRPTLRAMNECTNPQAPNTTLPHLLPIALLGERGPEDVLGTVAPSGLAAAILSPWENSAPDCGLSIVWSHLETARRMAENLPLFRRNAEIVLEGSRSDELLSDAFRTEFHIKFLWGSRGATVAPEERHLKFTQVLDAMYDKCSSSEVMA